MLEMKTKSVYNLEKGAVNVRCARKFCLPHFPLLDEDQFPSMLTWWASFVCEDKCTYIWW